jgi:trehalose-phosphatase
MTTESALKRVDEIARALAGQPHAVCLDYDGTLTPIRPSPPEAVLSANMRAAIVKLAECCHVAIVTGRGLGDARAMVGVDLIYAASHGFELQFPGEPAKPYAAADTYHAAIEETAETAEARADGIKGLMVERKPFSTAIHFRQTPADDLPKVEALLDVLAQQHPTLRTLRGKKVCEFQPRIDWDKGRAVLLLADRLGVARRGLLYIGDDVTDEDAFRAIAGEGIGVLVCDEPRETAARYHLRDPDEVRVFLEQLADFMCGAQPGENAP